MLFCQAKTVIIIKKNIFFCGSVLAHISLYTAQTPCHDEHIIYKFSYRNLIDLHGRHKIYSIIRPTLKLTLSMTILLNNCKRCKTCATKSNQITLLLLLTIFDTWSQTQTSYTKMYISILAHY